ncbi:MAG: hypothetical protein HC856_02865 [Pseudanabaena sp. RU_4_16]|nr:hypothetical protein [Pseudanabaena sp. RU_4_16]
MKKYTGILISVLVLQAVACSPTNTPPPVVTVTATPTPIPVELSISGSVFIEDGVLRDTRVLVCNSNILPKIKAEAAKQSPTEGYRVLSLWIKGMSIYRAIKEDKNCFADG